MAAGRRPRHRSAAVRVDEDRWQALSSGTDSSGNATGIAAAIGGEFFCDARGIP
jgi:hypothetical protein